MVRHISGSKKRGSQKRIAETYKESKNSEKKRIMETGNTGPTR
jgi:hypothetical protein